MIMKYGILIGILCRCFFGGYVGLKYEVLLLQGGLFDLYQVEDKKEMLEGLKIMEFAALKELNKEAKK